MRAISMIDQLNLDARQINRRGQYIKPRDHRRNRRFGNGRFAHQQMIAAIVAISGLHAQPGRRVALRIKIDQQTATSTSGQVQWQG